MLTLGVCRENVSTVGSRYDSGMVLDSGISRANFGPIFVKCLLKASAISAGVLMILSPILMSEMFCDFLHLREFKSFISIHVLRGSFMLSSKFSTKIVIFLVRLQGKLEIDHSLDVDCACGNC